MPEAWRTVSLGEVARLDIRRVPVDESRRYRIAGVLNSGQGVFERGEISGVETSYPAFHELRADQIVMRKLTAWEGPVAIVPAVFEGYCVSTEFPTFTIDRSALLPEFMAIICQRPPFWQSLRDRSTGTVQRRKRVSPTQFLSVTVELPPIPEQRRIVDLLEAAVSRIEITRKTAASCRALASSLRRDHFYGKSAPSMPAGEFFSVTMGRQRSPKHATGAHVVPYLRAANVKDGHLDLGDVKMMNFNPKEQAKFALQQGDVLVTEGCGSLKQLGASAVWSRELSGPVCFQNTLLRVRARPGLSERGYAYQWARYCFESGVFADIASGTNIFHIGSERTATIPVATVPIEEQQSLVSLVSAVDEAADKAQAVIDSATSVRGALLSDLLSGAHRIPSSYVDLMRDTG